MLTLKLTKEKLVDIIKNSKKEGNGYNGVLFLYNGYLLKIDKVLYDSIIKLNKEEAIERVSKYLLKDHFADYKQIEYLYQKQSSIKLTDFNLGVVEVNNVVVGTILPNHLDYKNLYDIKITKQEDFNLVFKILYKLLMAIRELDLNDINVLDLINNIKGTNVLYNKNDVKICDLEGMFVTYNSKYQKVSMYQEYLKVLMFLLNKMEKVNPKIKILKESINFIEENPYESLLEFLNILEVFIREDIQMFGLDDKDIVFNKNELFKEEKKVFIGDLVINSKDLKNDINIPSDAIYGNLIIEGEGQLENIYLPKFVYGNFLLKGFHSLKNIIFPIDIKGEKKFIDVNSLDNITFSSNYSLKDSFRSVRYIKNIIFPSSTNLGFDFMSLKELENVVLPKEVFYLFIPLVTSLKDVVLPLKVIDCLVIRDFRVLDGAIVKEDTNNYQIVTSSGRFYLFDILEHVSYNQDGLGKKLTVTNKYDII